MSVVIGDMPLEEDLTARAPDRTPAWVDWLREGRLMRVSAPEMYVLGLFTGKLKLTGVPSDVYLKNVFHNAYRECFELVIAHGSFERVQSGQVIPMFITLLENTSLENTGELLENTGEQRPL